MSYVAYTGLKTPDEVISSMADYVTNEGYPIVEPLKDDTNIYDRSSVDGKRFVFNDMEQNYFIMLRSANETNIFGTTDDSAMDITAPVTGNQYKGVGLTIGEGYSYTNRWYNQYNVPINHNGNIVQCGWMPMSSGIEDIPVVVEPTPVDEPVPVAPPVEPVYPDAPTPPDMPKDPGVSDTHIYNITDATPTSPLNVTSSDIILVNDLTNLIGTDDVVFLVGAGANRINNGSLPHTPYPAKLGTTTGNDAVVLGDSSTNISQLTLTYGATYSRSFGNHTAHGLCIPSDYVYQYQQDCSVNPTTGSSPGGYYPIVGPGNLFYYTQYLPPEQSGPRTQSPVYAMPKTDFDALQNDLNTQADYDNPNSTMWQDYNAAYAQYQADLATYQQNVADLDTQYQTDLATYQAYLQAKAAYDQYLVDVQNYNNYLDKIAKIQHIYTLFCNHLTVPTDTLTFSLVKVDTNTKLYQTTHLIMGILQKYDESWVGGMYFTASATHTMVNTAYKVYLDENTSDQYTLPVFSSGPRSNTFLRINVDEAPSASRGNILWACSGTDNVTGKKLSLPVRIVGASSNGKIPHYQFLQSQNRLDWGRDINTLNCITVNMPLYFSVNVDPDQLNLYAAVGVATGVFFISTLNMQTGFCYEQSYPRSGDLCQVFPMGKRRGKYGFDGISIRQRDGE